MQLRKLHFSLPLALSLLFLSASAAEKESIDHLVKRLSGEGVAPAAEELASAYDRVIEALIPGLASSQTSDVEKADNTLKQVCWHAGRPDAEPERLAASKALAARLGEEVPAPARAYIIRQLGLIGRREAVPPLARLLKSRDPALREKARRALQRNPAEEAGAALREAVPGAEREFRVALISSLGARRDHGSLDLLLDEAKTDDEALRTAAVESLARLGDAGAVPAIASAMGRGSPGARHRAANALLILADNLAERGERLAAVKIYRRLLTEPPPATYAALIGLGRLAGPSELPIFLSAIASDDREIRGAALEAVEAMPTEVLAKSVERELADAPSGVRVAFLDILARRQDPATVGVFLSAVNDPDSSVRIAGLHGLAGVGGQKALEPILETLRSGRAPEQDVAARSLSRGWPDLPAGVLVSVFEKAKGDARPTVIQVMAARKDRRLIPVLISAVNDRDEAVRIAAMKALGHMHAVEGLPAVLAALAGATETERDAAEYALRHMTGEEATGEMIAALDRATDPVRASILRAIGPRDDPRLLPILMEAARSASDILQAAAAEGIATKKDRRVLPVLMELAEKGSPEVRRIGVSASLQWATALQNEDSQTARSVYIAALRLAEWEDPLRAALRGLGEVGSEAELDSIRPFLGKPALGRDAAEASVQIANRLPASRRDEAIGVYREALKHTIDPAVAGRVIQRLRRFGIEVDPARESGFVTFWWLAGPFTVEKGSLWEVAFPPEKEVNLRADIKVGDQSYRWTAHHTPDLQGVVDLYAAVAPRENAVAYMYSEMTVPQSLDVLLKMGSDDGIECWLNGRRVHSNRTDRGVTPDQDVVKASFHGGVNTILLKVVNNAGGWAACLRIMDQQGTPLKFTQREE